VVSTGDFSQVASNSYRAHITCTGDDATITSTGSFSQIESNGKNAIIFCAGRESQVKAEVGSWITFSGLKYSADVDGYVTTTVTVYVDGEKIKADTWCSLVGGDIEVHN
jgi:hypothetical protein